MIQSVSPLPLGWVGSEADPLGRLQCFQGSFYECLGLEGTWAGNMRESQTSAALGQSPQLAAVSLGSAKGLEL